MGAKGLRPPRDAAVGVWLLMICALVVVMILVGGATRLTDSGLSITEWRPVTGAIPPMSDADWASEFAKYRGRAEYQMQNAGMSLAEFQFIYWWEWAHRFLGRFIGVVFGVGFLLLWMAGRLKGRMTSTLVLGALGALQGGVGWWMVHGGLDLLDVPPVRLAVHLGLAFIILGLGWRMALGALGWPNRPGAMGAPAWLGWLFVILLFVQICAGALVAGSDAGRAYSDWPRIGGEWFPSSYFTLEPHWRNAIENHAALQFNHRTLGYVIGLIALVITLAAWLRSHGAARIMVLVMFCATLAQIWLGIHTIRLGAPLDLSLTHQGCAIVLWLSSLAMLRANAMR
jgi:cytochrome c oxidase assembly protein subunit 15